MERLSLAKAVSDRASKQRLQALDSQLNSLKAEQARSHSLSCLYMRVVQFLFMAAHKLLCVSCITHLLATLLMGQGETICIHDTRLLVR